MHRIALPFAARIIRNAPIRFTAVALVIVPALGMAQSPARDTARDTARTRADSAQALEAVTVSAIRGGSEAPISKTRLQLEDIEQRQHGQDIPLLLQGTPSLTIKSETGTPWGYSYIRLRGMEHRRINFTLDGIPLNDPEDHVLYFADFPDLANSLQSIEVQRGVGTSSTGMAAYAGSVNLESISLASAPRAFEAQAQAGSFDSRRGSAEYGSGLMPNRAAFYVRGSALSTDGYRRHAGIDARSFFFSGGYFGDRDVVKLIATAGVFEDTMAYTGASPEQIAEDRRFNPLRPDETDRFAEQVTGLTYVRALGAASSISTMLYRIAADGAFNVCIDRCDQAAADLWRFRLDFSWYGATSAWTLERDGLRLDLGANANTYARDHHAYVLPDETRPLYLNTGHKRDVSGFAKLAYDVLDDRATLFGDVQVRTARFRYEPDADAGIAEPSIDWTFVNPKIGLTYRAGPAVSLYGSYGVNNREPSREDMFAGFDNLDTTNIGFVGSLEQVRPERARDLEAGITLRARGLSLQANVFDMRFRNEILPIGELSYIGTPLRKNVPSSYRRGVEVDVTASPSDVVTTAFNATVMTSRIREYTDRDGVTYRDVPALLTPVFQSMQRVGWRFLPAMEVTMEGRYVAESQLTNTDDPSLVLPPSYVMDGVVSWELGRGRYVVSVYGFNLGNSRRYSTGNVSSSGTPRFFVLAPRSFQAVAQVVF
ncbi:MAG: TonB-dependent receptor [Gemmatimonadaceae bacterium]